MGVCMKERKGVTAVVLMATPCTNSLVAFGERWWVLFGERWWVLLKIPRCDIDEVGEGK